MMRWGVLALAVCAAGCQTTALAPSVLPSANAFDAEVAEQIRAPGLVAAILRDGRVTEVYAWGGADCAGEGAANVNAAYEIGSISKHVTAVALLQLWERGAVDIDAPVGRYLEDIPQAWRAVTLRQLLTHTSGVPDYEEAGGYGVYETEPTPAEVYAIVADRPLDFEPGARWSYSNTGYYLLSLVVERVSGERFGDYLRTHLFAPIGMTHSFMGGYAPEDVTLAQGCKPGESPDAPRLPVRPITETSTYGAGGISSTLQDWALWDDALQEGRLLSPEAMALLLETQRLNDGSDTGYAFGLFVDTFRGEPRRHHSGQTQGFSANYAHFPERDASIILFANTYGARFGPALRQLELTLMPDLSYDRLAVPADPDPQRTAATRRALRQLAFAEAPYDLLTDDMRAFAQSEGAAAARETLRPHAEHADELAYLRSDPPDGAFQRHIYKSVIDGETSYFAFTWRDGLLAGIRIEPE